MTEYHLKVCWRYHVPYFYKKFVVIASATTSTVVPSAQTLSIGEVWDAWNTCNTLPGPAVEPAWVLEWEVCSKGPSTLENL